MTTPADVARNAAAIRNLAQRFETWGLSDPQQRAELVAMNLLADGLRPVEKPVPPPSDGGSQAARDAARAACRDAIRAAKEKGKRL